MRQSFFFSLLVLQLIGCAPKQIVQSPIPYFGAVKAGKVEAEARPMFTYAERAFAAKNYDEALKYYKIIKTKYPRGRAAQLSSYRIGSLYYYRAQYDESSVEFGAFLTRYPDSPLTFDVTYNLAATEFQKNNYERAYQLLSTLRLADVQAQGLKRAEVVYNLTTRTASALGNHLSVVSMVALQLQLGLEESRRSELFGLLDETIPKITNVTDLESSVASITEPSVREKLIAQIEKMKLVGAAEIKPSEPPALSQSSSGERWNVGIILPLTGKYALNGRRVLDSLLLAAKIFDAESNTPLRLFTRDSASNPTLARIAAEELINDKKVMAIIGPLVRKEAEAIAEISNQSGVPNLSLNAKEGLASKHAFVIQNALTAKVQMDNLVRFCVQKKQFTRFAAMGPKDEFGKDMVRQFVMAVRALGGVVVGYQEYPVDETDFRKYIQSIIGLEDPRHRKSEWNALNTYLRESKSKDSKAPKGNIPPIVDFDALFIADNTRVAVQVVASLNYFDVGQIPLLGTTGWSSVDYKRGGRLLEGSYFPMGTSLRTSNERQQQYFKSFVEKFGRKPDLLSTQAFEAMELLLFGLENTPSSDRTELLQQILKMNGLETSMGKISFLGNVIHRELPIVTLGKGGQLIEQASN